MEVVVGKNAGFCYGVKNAVEGAKKELDSHTKPVYFWGEIVHNQQVIEALENEGAIFVEDMNQVRNQMVIRAHGVTKEVYQEAQERGITLQDYTCPNVLKIHQLAEKYANDGYYIILFGSKKHPETIGTMSYCGSQYYVVEDEVELYHAIDIINQWQIQKVFVISQTTFNLEMFYIFQSILEEELRRDIQLVIQNTICNATQIRQQETEKIASEVDCMVIIGGKNSSNTKKLCEVAEGVCDSVILAETKEDIKNVNFSFFKKVGVMAGASTPQSSIDEIVSFLKDRS